MRKLVKAGFLRHFISGFVLGAIGLGAVQVVEAAHAQETAPPAATQKLH
ncbi:hypothetical protein [Stakelama saccharophila]|uniref:Uncharacterized protein n=1 Tax=Stakelama saccharophila TaxID=3075605 RepID=A0ABZ0BA73_9SPHN|nr:hypothetical protein [Stakelama sp. W311]WNO53980.1 hypothetical protein RPR59_01590 [Stakelama sp. W311]